MAYEKTKKTQKSKVNVETAGYQVIEKANNSMCCTKLK